MQVGRSAIGMAPSRRSATSNRVHPALSNRLAFSSLRVLINLFVWSMPTINYPSSAMVRKIDLKVSALAFSVDASLRSSANVMAPNTTPAYSSGFHELPHRTSSIPHRSLRDPQICPLISDYAETNSCASPLIHGWQIRSATRGQVGCKRLVKWNANRWSTAMQTGGQVNAITQTRWGGGKYWLQAVWPEQGVLPGDVSTLFPTERAFLLRVRHEYSPSR